MSTTCKDCKHEFGEWRDRCPACGTPAPAKAAPFNKVRITPERKGAK